MTEASTSSRGFRQRDMLRGAHCGLACSGMAMALFVVFLSAGWSGPTWEPSLLSVLRRDALKFIGLAEDGPKGAHAVVAILVLAAGAVFGAEIGRRSGEIAGSASARRLRLLVRAAGWYLALVLGVVIIVLLPEVRAAHAADLSGLAMTAVVAFAVGATMLVPFASVPFVASTLILEEWTRPAFSDADAGIRSRSRPVLALLGMWLLSATVAVVGIFRLLAIG